MNIYVVQHIHELEDEREDSKCIGVYSSYEQAKKAVTKLSMQPGFRTAQNGFSINKYKIDEDHWKEGYVTTYESEENEHHVQILFENMSASIVCEEQYDEIVHVLLGRSSGSWHDLEELAQDNRNIQQQLEELQQAFERSTGESSGSLYCQWAMYPESTEYAIISFHLQGTVLFLNTIHNITRFK